jgi:transglutaminase-like putative cysteine protease
VKLRAAGIVGALGLVGLVAYPRPILVARTLPHARRPGVDPDAVVSLAAELPDDADAVREHVVRRLVPFTHDWDVYRVPYYFPTLSEVLDHRRGDCKGQALAIASLLAAKRIPYRLLVSPDHIWVEYEGKAATAMEDPAVGVAEFRDGRWHALRPSRLRLRANACVSAAAYWGAAPRERRVVVAGLLFALGCWAVLQVRRD